MTDPLGFDCGPATLSEDTASDTGSGTGLAPLRVNTALTQHTLHQVLDLALPPMVIFAASGRVVFANRRFRELFNLPEDRPDGDSLGQFRSILMDFAAGRGQGMLERRTIRYRHLVFEVEFCRLSGQPGTSDSDGLMVAVLRDITDHARALEQAQNAQTKLHDFVECSSDWLWETDDRGRLTFLSMRLTQISGSPAQMFQGCRFGDIGRFTKPGLADLVESDEFRTRLPFRDFELEITDRNGAACPQWISGVPIFEPQSGRFTGYRGTGTDVSQQVAASRALRASQDQLTLTLATLRRKNAELIASFEAAEAGHRTKSAFLANISHELRTPLNAIIGFSEVLKMEIFGTLGHDQYRAYTRDIHASATRLLDLITKILELSNIESGHKELNFGPVDLAEEARRALGAIEETARRKSLTLALDAASDLTTVEADAGAIRQMLDQLLSNALRFTPAGGRMGVTVHREHGRAVLTVRDTGVGIPEADLARLGRPFERVGRDYVLAEEQGSGLGLALARALAELHGGHLRLDSRVGQGTTVTVDLPLRQPGITAEAQVAAVEPAAPPIVPPNGGARRPNGSDFHPS